MAKKIKEIQADDFENDVLKKGVAVVDFYSTECPPCEALAPKFEGLSELYGDDIPFV
ncbi:MAG: thioredoxin-disulfide reductase, partial [Spirochaetales bacterium]|nr:thioredoxin-disulfide reductase [Spirochaetales bacterium]